MRRVFTFLLADQATREDTEIIYQLLLPSRWGWLTDSNVAIISTEASEAFYLRSSAVAGGGAGSHCGAGSFGAAGLDASGGVKVGDWAPSASSWASRQAVEWKRFKEVADWAAALEALPALLSSTDASAGVKSGMVAGGSAGAGGFGTASGVGSGLIRIRFRDASNVTAGLLCSRRLLSASPWRSGHGDWARGFMQSDLGGPGGREGGPDGFSGLGQSRTIAAEFSFFHFTEFYEHLADKNGRKKVKDDWSKYRLAPLALPHASPETRRALSEPERMRESRRWPASRKGILQRATVANMEACGAGDNERRCYEECERVGCEVKTALQEGFSRRRTSSWMGFPAQGP
eukprot:gene5843-biopygen5866